MIVSAHPDVNVSIFTGAAYLREFEDPDNIDDTSRAATRYVEAQCGSDFTISLDFSRCFKFYHNDLEVKVWLDGTSVMTLGIVARSSPITIKGSESFRNGKWELRRFQFSALELDETGGKPVVPTALQGLGIITVTLTPITKRTVPLPAKNSRPKKMIGANKVPEKALKGRAISTSTALSEPIDTHQHRSCYHAEYPWGEAPIATYQFKYRTHRELQIEGIVPRSPTPVPLEERDPEKLSAEEARELVRRMRATHPSASSLKKEKRELADVDSASNDDKDVVVQSEGPARKRSRNDMNVEVEVIDLT